MKNINSSLFTFFFCALFLCSSVTSATAQKKSTFEPILIRLGVWTYAGTCEPLATGFCMIGMTTPDIEDLDENELLANARINDSNELEIVIDNTQLGQAFFKDAWTNNYIDIENSYTLTNELTSTLSQNENYRSTLEGLEVSSGTYTIVKNDKQSTLTIPLVARATTTKNVDVNYNATTQEISVQKNIEVSNETIQLILCNMNGQVLLNKTMQDGETVDLNYLNTGIYVLQVRTASAVLTTEKIFVK